MHKPWNKQIRVSTLQQLLNTEANHMRVDRYGTKDIQPEQYLDFYQQV